MEYTVDCSNWNQEKFLQLFGVLKNTPDTRLVLYWEETSKAESITLEKCVSEHLKQLGISQHLKGYNYIKYGTLNCIKHPEDIESITKVLYPKIAKKYNTTPGKVEHGIRHAIKGAWDKEQSKEWEKVFGKGYSERISRPTNAQFIAALSDFISVNNNI